MKKFFASIAAIMFAAVVIAFAAEDIKQDLRPAQKIMQARVALLAAVTKNLNEKQYDLVAKAADELAAETQKTGNKLPNPLAKDLTLAISIYASDISTAAVKKDDEAIKVKLEGIKGKCGECHAKIRDKK